MLLDLVNRINSERKFLKKFRHASLSNLKVLYGTSWGRPESTSQGRRFNVRLRRPLDVISGRPQDVRLGRFWEVRSGRAPDGQIGSLGDVLGALEGNVLGTSWGPIFAGWVKVNSRHQIFRLGVLLNVSFLYWKWGMDRQKIILQKTVRKY